jgi:hypothetical protein
MTVIEAPKPVVRGPQVWPLGVKAYHALGDLGLIPEKTELLYGQVTDRNLLFARPHVLDAARVKENCFSLSFMAVPSCRTWRRVSTGR